MQHAFGLGWIADGPWVWRASLFTSMQVNLIFNIIDRLSIHQVTPNYNNDALRLGTSFSEALERGGRGCWGLKLAPLTRRHHWSNALARR